MKKLIYILITLLVVASSQSCSTVNIASNKQAGYDRHLQKIFVFVNCDKNSNVFCSGLVKGLKKKFNEKGVQSDSDIHDPLSLETQDDINKRITAYGSEAVLMIEQTITGGGRCVFELTLIDEDTKKHVWKSELEVSADSYTSIEDQGVINKGVKAVTDKLAQDKII